MAVICVLNLRTKCDPLGETVSERLLVRGVGTAT